MSMNLWISRLCGLTVALGGLVMPLAAQPAVGQDTAVPITVIAASGRIFAAEVDARTDRSHLWLCRRRGSAAVLRPIRWDRVVAARLAGEDVSGGQLHAIVEAIVAELPPPVENAKAARTLVIPPSDASVAPAAAASDGPPQIPRVRSLSVEAVAANWDADVEVDGLLLRVYPLDAGGAIVPVRGTIEVDLIVQRGGVARRSHRLDAPGRWTRRVRLADFGSDGAVYRLPFQRAHPEFNPNLAPYATVHARLHVPGRGSFDATAADVRVRPYSAARDRLQHTTGRRFFPQERTGPRFRAAGGGG